MSRSVDSLHLKCIVVYITLLSIELHSRDGIWWRCNILTCLRVPSPYVNFGFLLLSYPQCHPCHHSRKKWKKRIVWSIKFGTRLAVLLFILKLSKIIAFDHRKLPFISFNRLYTYLIDTIQMKNAFIL